MKKSIFSKPMCCRKSNSLTFDEIFTNSLKNLKINVLPLAIKSAAVSPGVFALAVDVIILEFAYIGRALHKQYQKMKDLMKIKSKVSDFDFLQNMFSKI